MVGRVKVWVLLGKGYFSCIGDCIQWLLTIQQLHTQCDQLPFVSSHLWLKNGLFHGYVILLFLWTWPFTYMFCFWQVTSSASGQFWSCFLFVTLSCLDWLLFPYLTCTWDPVATLPYLRSPKKNSTAATPFWIGLSNSITLTPKIVLHSPQTCWLIWRRYAGLIPLVTPPQGERNNRRWKTPLSNELLIQKAYTRMWDMQACGNTIESVSPALFLSSCESVV